MHVGKTLYARIMEFVRWKTFGWINGYGDLWRLYAMHLLTFWVFEKTELLCALQPDRMPPKPPSSDVDTKVASRTHRGAEVPPTSGG